MFTRHIRIKNQMNHISLSQRSERFLAFISYNKFTLGVIAQLILEEISRPVIKWYILDKENSPLALRLRYARGTVTLERLRYWSRWSVSCERSGTGIIGAVTHIIVSVLYSWMQPVTYFSFAGIRFVDCNFTLT